MVEQSQLKKLGLRKHPFNTDWNLRYYVDFAGLAQQLDIAQHLLQHTHILASVTGVAGTGKSVYLEKLISRLGQDIFSVSLEAEVNLTITDLSDFILSQFNTDNIALQAKDDLLDKIISLVAAYSTPAHMRKNLLIIKSAHNLSREVLNFIFKIIQSQVGVKNPLHILLVGAPLLTSQLQLLVKEQKNTADCYQIQLNNLQLFDTEKLIRKHFQMAGLKSGVLPFSTELIAEIHVKANGHPQKIIDCAKEAFDKLIVTAEGIVQEDSTEDRDLQYDIDEVITVSAAEVVDSKDDCINELGALKNNEQITVAQVTSEKSLVVTRRPTGRRAGTSLWIFMLLALLVGVAWAFQLQLSSLLAENKSQHIESSVQNNGIGQITLENDFVAVTMSAEPQQKTLMVEERIVDHSDVITRGEKSPFAVNFLDGLTTFSVVPFMVQVNGAVQYLSQERVDEAGVTMTVNAADVAESSTLEPLSVDQRTLFSFDKDDYTVQLFGSAQQQDVEDFISHNPLPDELYRFQTIIDGRQWYSLVYGVYPSMTAARQAIKVLPDNIKQEGPWVRSLLSVQNAIKKQHNEPSHES